MMRLAIAVQSAAIAAVLSLISVTSSQATQWTVTPGVPGANSIQVTVSALIGPPDANFCNSGPFAGPGTNWLATLAVAPCPPGATCFDGVYTAQYFGFTTGFGLFTPSDTITLLDGVHYTFSGSWSYSEQVSTPGGPQNCAGGAPMTDTHFFNPFPSIPVQAATWNLVKQLYR